MYQSIYVAGAEARSGKSLVVLGLMEHLISKLPKVGYFRPVIADAEKGDSLTRLITSRYHIDWPLESLYGVSQVQAANMLAHRQQDDLLKIILAKYKALEQACDIVVCVGSDFSGTTSPLELDFNADLANSLGSYFLPVVSGHRRSAQETAEAVMLLQEYLDQQRCEVLGVIVNRVDEDKVESVRSRLSDSSVPYYVLPEHSVLEKPSVGEVAQTLGLQRLSGDEAAFNHVVNHFKIAAMPVDEFLARQAGCGLIITPGNRSDIVVATIASDAAVGTPRVAGLLLTGGDVPNQSVMQIIEGLHASRVPIMLSPWDTFTTAMKVNEVKGNILATDESKIALALGVMEAHVDAAQLTERLVQNPSRRKSPAMFEYEMIQRAKSQRMRIVLPESKDERVLRAADIISLRDIVDITLLGNEDLVRQKQEQLGLALRGVKVIDPASSPLLEEFANSYYELRKHKGITREMAADTLHDVSYFGTMMVHRGYADGMVSGAAHTTQHTIRPAFEIIKTSPGSSLVSSVFFMLLEDRVLVYGDCAINPNPNAEQLADIAIASSETAQRFGIEPLTALLSYSTGQSGKGTDVDKVREAAKIARERRPDLHIEGPIQYDAAVDASVARSKLPDSQVAGKATVFVFPDLNTGNNTYKAVQRSANAVAIGPVLQGLNKPVNDLSRGCTVVDIVNTVVITAIQAQG